MRKVSAGAEAGARAGVRSVIRRTLKGSVRDRGGDIRKFSGLRISSKCKIPDSKARFQIPFGIPSELYEIPAGVGPLDDYPRKTPVCLPL